MQNNRMRSQEAYDRSTIATARALEHAKAAANEKQRASEDYYLSHEIERVVRHKETEPAITGLIRARKIRAERETDLDRSKLKSDGEINRYLESVKEEIRERAWALKFQVYEIGQLLTDAKNLLEHGQFQNWLKDNFPLSEKTANNCMNVYKACMGHPELVQHFPVSSFYVLCAPLFPKELRQQLLDNAIGVYDIGPKELLQTAMRYKAGEIELDGPEVQKLLARQKKLKIINRAKVEMENILSFLNRRSKVIETLRQQSQAHPLLPLEESSRDDAIYSEAGSLLEQLISLTEDKIKELSYAEKE